MEVSKVTIRGA